MPDPVEADYRNTAMVALRLYRDYLLRTPNDDKSNFRQLWPEHINQMIERLKSHEAGKAQTLPHEPTSLMQGRVEESK